MLNWWLTEHYAAVVTDSVGHTPAGDPVFMDKAVIHPRSSAVSAQYGAYLIFPEWVQYVERSAERSDILVLNDSAPKVLSGFADRVSNLPPTASLYCFGWLGREAGLRFTGYRYRAATGFASELLENGADLNPPLQSEDQSPLIEGDPNSLIAASLLQADQDAALLDPWQRKVGGPLVAHQMILGRDGRPHFHTAMIQRLPHSDRFGVPKDR